MKQYDIGIDLGTTSIIIATEEQGVVFRQPTIGAVDTRTNSIIAVGDEALKMWAARPPISTWYALCGMASSRITA